MENQTITLAGLSETELKALAFDETCKLDLAKHNVNAIVTELKERVSKQTETQVSQPLENVE